MLPILYQSPELIIYSYPLMMGLGWGTGHQVLSETIPLAYSRFQFQFLFWGLFLTAWIGAKILFILTIPKELSQGIFETLSFWMGGGFVFYGGFLGGILFLLFLNKFVVKLSYDLLWSLLPALTIGHGIGRLGCFLAGCCFGDETTLPWGVFQHGHYRHPTQLLEAAFLIILGLYLLKSKQPKKSLILNYFFGYGIFRFCIEFLRGDSIRGSWFGLSPSQIISLGVIFLGVLFIKKRVISVN